MPTENEFDLPPEVIDAMKGPEQLKAGELEALGINLARLRQESIVARQSSNIESIWSAAEDAYLGIDDANRHEAGARWEKPNSTSGPLTSNTVKGDGEQKSTVFVRLTSRYVDCAAAKMGEILLPVDDKAFSFDATPMPELLSAKQDSTQVTHNGVPLERDPRPGEVPSSPGAPASTGGGAPAALPAGSAPAAAPGPASPGVPLTVKDLAEEVIQQAQASAKRAERRIYDWMVEAQYPAEMRKVIFDSARIGVGVLKGPFPKKKVARAVTRGVDGRATVALQVKIVPTYEWRDPWNIFPHRACGENIQNGDNIFERDFYSSRQLKALKGTTGYIDSAIDKVLKEGPGARMSPEAGNPNKNLNEHRFEVWFFHGVVKRSELTAAGTEVPAKEGAKPEDDVYALCTLVNSTVIRAVLNPLESGEFPYHAMPWQRRAGYWAGVGVGEQIAVPQRMINGATRTMMDNAGRSAGSITVLDRGAIVPADGKWSLGRDKLYFKAADAVIDDVRKAFAFFQIPNATDPLMKIVEYALRLAEESTSIPLVTQGQSGQTTPETYGATQLQNNNANQLLRSIGYSFDDHITEPVVRQSYEWLLLDDEVPDDEKGDWSINAHGSTAFVERAIQDQVIAQMAAFVKDPAYGTDPKRWFAEFMRSKHMNPTTFQYTPEEQAKIDAAPKPAAPAVEVAKIKSADHDKKLAAEAQMVQAQGKTAVEVAHVKAEGDMQVAELDDATARERVKRDIDRDTMYVQAETERTRLEDQARREELALRRELAILEYANREKQTLEQVRAKLADKAMTLNTQRELAAAEHAAGAATQRRDHAVELHMHHTPPAGGAEPPGKAPDGQAFTK